MRHRMLRNYFFVNLILLVIIVFLSVRFYEAYKHSMSIPQEPSVMQDQKESVQDKEEINPLDPTLFQIISNMDLFRPSRSPYREEVAMPAIPKIPPRLFGTVILNNQKSAILEDPNTKATRSYHVNEPIGGYVISEILEDRVVLSWNGEKSEVKLREEKKGLPPVRQQIMPQPQPSQAPPQQMQPQPVVPQQPVPRPVPQRPIPQRPRPVPPSSMENR